MPDNKEILDAIQTLVAVNMYAINYLMMSILKDDNNNPIGIKDIVPVKSRAEDLISSVFGGVQGFRLN